MSWLRTRRPSPPPRLAQASSWARGDGSRGQSEVVTQGIALGHFDTLIHLESALNNSIGMGDRARIGREVDDACHQGIGGLLSSGGVLELAKSPRCRVEVLAGLRHVVPILFDMGVTDRDDVRDFLPKRLDIDAGGRSNRGAGRKNQWSR
jgi:hypothetical protein